MAQPTVELVPLYPAVRTDAPVTLDVLVRITPPQPETKVERPALNLGLVIDRSGSMSSLKKIDYAREAAAFAVSQLLPTDRVSLTIFDDKVETLVPNAPVGTDRSRLLEAIRGVTPNGSTALHGGWREGATQVGTNSVPGGLNRVLLLSDGLANAGETNPDVIATDVHRVAREGVSTSTMGLGDDYNEDLLEAMARSGDGNYYYVENPGQLPDIFRGELLGLIATSGRAVTLGVEPRPGAALADVLNDLDRTPAGLIKLPNLVAGMPVLAVVRLAVPAGEAEVCRFRLAWDGPDGRQEVVTRLVLPAVPGPAWESLAPSVEVHERAVLLVIARLKKEATARLDRGDVDGAWGKLREAKALLATAPPTPEVYKETGAIGQIEAYIERGDFVKFRKHAHNQAYQRRSSKPYDPPA